MDPLFRDILRLAREGTPFALGTVAHTSGSTPQKAGAKAVFLPDGTILGTLGGGCMEAEARQRGLRLVRDGEPELMVLHLDDDFGWDDGLICGGTANIFLQPMREPQREVFEAAVRMDDERGRGVFALVIEAENNRSLGRVCLFRQGEGIIGDVGGEALAAAIEETSRGLLLEGSEDPQRIGLKEAGATVYFEPMIPAPRLFIAGAGHIGAALCRYAAQVGFDVAVVDDRPSLCNAKRMPEASDCLVEDIVECARRWPMTPETYCVLVTRGHRHDAEVLREIIAKPLAYIGMIGSRRKILTVFKQFLADGLATREQLARVHAPIGLDVGSKSVEEIALCIAAELVLVRRKGTRYAESGPGEESRDGDRAGGGGVAPDGDAEAAFAVRQGHRAAGSRPLADSLPRGRDPRDPGSS